jgi:hypothetical protein
MRIASEHFTTDAFTAIGRRSTASDGSKRCPLRPETNERLSIALHITALQLCTRSATVDRRMSSLVHIIAGTGESATEFVTTNG